jgi:hypothetical protein
MVEMIRFAAITASFASPLMLLGALAFGSWWLAGSAIAIAFLLALFGRSHVEAYMAELKPTPWCFPTGESEAKERQERLGNRRPWWRW